jgi:L-lactate dehydrogenase complex protein LldG
MSTSRDLIIGRIRKATTSLPHPAPRPDYKPDLPVARAGRRALQAADLKEAFATAWRAISGRYAGDWEELAAALRADAPALGYCAPEFVGALRAVWPEAPVETVFERARVDEYAFAITPAWGAIAETGTVVLTDRTSPARLAALAPWTHVAVVPAGRIFPTVAAAVAAFPDDPSIVMVTGPSKTADIEGILIQGVHGPGLQYAIVS